MYLRRSMSNGLPSCPISLISPDQLATSFLPLEDRSIAMLNNNGFHNDALSRVVGQFLKLRELYKALSRILCERKARVLVINIVHVRVFLHMGFEYLAYSPAGDQPRVLVAPCL